MKHGLKNLIRQKLRRSVQRTTAAVQAIRNRSVPQMCKLCQGRARKRAAYGRVFYECLECSFVFTLDYSKVGLDRGMGMEGSWTGPGGGGYREYFLVNMLRQDLGVKEFLLFGTGNTPTFKTLVSEGVDVVGCDVSPDVVKFKQKEFGKALFFSPLDLPKHRPFGAIVAVEVFEHFAEPHESFSLLMSRVRADGIVCGTTDFYQGGEIEDGNTPGYMSLGGHVAYWSIKSMRRIASDYGRAVSAFEMVRPGSVLPDEKYGQLYPNKRVFFIFNPAVHGDYFSGLQKHTPILPIDKA